MSGSFEFVWWITCVHRLDLSFYSHLKEFWGNEVRTHVNSKGKIPSTRKILPRGGSNPQRCIKQDSKPNTLPTRYSSHQLTQLKKEPFYTHSSTLQARFHSDQLWSVQEKRTLKGFGFRSPCGLQSNWRPLIQHKQVKVYHAYMQLRALAHTHAHTCAHTHTHTHTHTHRVYHITHVECFSSPLART